MTREGARGNLIHAIRWNDIPKKEALEIAIKALEQQTCEDAISREDALMALTGEWTEPTDELIHRFIRRIKNLPSVKPQYTEDEIQKMQDLEQAEIQKAYELGKAEELKTGHWIEHEPFDADHHNCNVCIECSNCHTWFGHDCYAKTDYCPKCGAKMVEPQESEGSNADND